MELDRISNLPSGIKEQILSCLSIKEASRTSVLSSQWRYRAAMLQDLVFDYRCRSAHKYTTFADIVDHVLLAHIGPIRKFKLAGNYIGTTRHIDRWILHLSRNSIKEFILEQYVEAQYKIPSCLFSCQDMINLELCSCLVELPSTFKGFRGLKSLYFANVTLAQDVFEKLIVCCPLLERLTLMHCDSFSHLKIDAPNLQFLDVRGSFKDVNLVNTSNLVDVSIGLEDFEFYVEQTQVSDSSSNLVKFLSYLPNVQRLDIYSCSLMYLAIGALPEKLPQPCLYLNFLHITLTLTNLEEGLTALCLLRSCPVVQELEILVFPGHEAVGKENCWLDYNRRCSLSQLRCVTITEIRNVKAELHFIRYLLLNSPVLEKMTVLHVSGIDSSKLEEKLLRFRRASKHTQVQRLDIYCCSLMYLAIGALPGKLPKPCLYLNCLHITISLTNLEETLTALCLFRSCPALQELEVQVFPGHEVVGKGNSWLDENRRCSFGQLRRVFINDISDVKAELDFIRYLLLSSPVLERMTVQPVPGRR